MVSAETHFWRETDCYHDLAKMFEQNVEITAPGDHFECKITGIGHCPFCASSVTYYEYRGPKV